MGSARSIICFTANVITDPDHPDTADTLEAMCDEHLVLAHAFHSAPDARRYRTTVEVDDIDGRGCRAPSPCTDHPHQGAAGSRCCGGVLGG
ncbi:hypothetical protein [Streptomyces lavenduligriseus]|uniref:hypothetical protein n=1 Tax=Streptomyces lavenduligriseus TaxID=67315 RepID=UPI002018EFAD|nr:hypothetical protein [Streptomyces lavenduligriseus]